MGEQGPTGDEKPESGLEETRRRAAEIEARMRQRAAHEQSAGRREETSGELYDATTVAGMQLANMESEEAAHDRAHQEAQRRRELETEAFRTSAKAGAAEARRRLLGGTDPEALSRKKAQADANKSRFVRGVSIGRQPDWPGAVNDVDTARERLHQLIQEQEAKAAGEDSQDATHEP